MPLNELDIPARKSLGFILILLCLIVYIPGMGTLPLIDRDEARYAQASVQMAQSQDYVNIRFQDQARNKKPAGIYWMQVAGLKIFSDPYRRDIWVHRLPSVLGAMIAVLASYWAGIILIGRRAAFYGAALLSVSLLLVFEAHQAKTDAVLAGLAALEFYLVARLRQLAHTDQHSSQKPLNPTRDMRLIALGFWAIMGVALMIKGPVLPGLIFMALLFLFIWEKQASYLRALSYWLGPVIFILITLPWLALIWAETNGQFFRDALGGDFGSKLTSSQEQHGGIVGYYLLTLPIMFWPGSLFLICGIAYIITHLRASRQRLSISNPSEPARYDTVLEIKNLRLLICWVLPAWVIMELIPTKLPHYPLPLYPAIALMAGLGVKTVMDKLTFPKITKFSLLFFIGVTMVLLGVIIYALINYAPLLTHKTLLSVVIILLVGLSMGLTCIAIGRGQGERAFFAALLTTVLITPLTYHYIAPNLSGVLISKQIEDVFTTENIPLTYSGGPIVVSPHYREPSLVYRLGTQTLLHMPDDICEHIKTQPEIVFIFRQDQSGDMDRLRQCKVELDILASVSGINYAKGDDLKLDIIYAKPQD